MKESIEIAKLVIGTLLLMTGFFTLLISVLPLIAWLAMIGDLISGKPVWKLPFPYLFAMVGTFGWIALFRLVLLSKRPLNQLPKWVLWGVLAGIVTAAIVGASLGSIGAFAILPIATALILLLQNWLLIPKELSKRTLCKTCTLTGSA